MANGTQPYRDQLFLPPKWRSAAARRSGPLMAYDASPAASRRARDSEQVAPPDNSDAIEQITKWAQENLSPSEIDSLISGLQNADNGMIGGMDSMSRLARTRVVEAFTRITEAERRNIKAFEESIGDDRSIRVL